MLAFSNCRVCLTWRASREIMKRREPATAPAVPTTGSVVHSNRHVLAARQAAVVGHRQGDRVHPGMWIRVLQVLHSRGGSVTEVPGTRCDRAIAVGRAIAESCGTS